MVQYRVVNGFSVPWDIRSRLSSLCYDKSEAVPGLLFSFRGVPGPFFLSGSIQGHSRLSSFCQGRSRGVPGFLLSVRKDPGAFQVFFFLSGKIQGVPGLLSVRKDPGAFMVVRKSYSPAL